MSISIALKPYFLLLSGLGFSLSGVAQDYFERALGCPRGLYDCSRPQVVSGLVKPQKKSAVYFQFEKQEFHKNLKSLGFRFLEGKPEDYFMAYLLNTGPTDTLFELQDGSLFIIQEALNKDGNWVPIEHWRYSTCGNSYHMSLHLKSNTAVRVPIKIYSGTFETKIRLKIKNGDSIAYSEQFDANIDENQFRDWVGPDPSFNNRYVGFFEGER